MKNTVGCGKIAALLLFCAVGVISSTAQTTRLDFDGTKGAQTFTSLFRFEGADGANPLYMSLVQGIDGSLYGTTMNGGVNDNGTVFKVSSDGGLMALHSFGGTDGYYPFGVVQATNGNLYGTTQEGGTPGGGTVFEITLSGVLTTLYNFCTQSNCSDGYFPVAAMIEGADGNFYGTTEFGGTNDGGTVFKISPRGALTTLYSFCAQSNCADGARPLAGLVQGIDGNFYGTTYYGGSGNGGNCFDGESYGCGTVFQITRQGTLTTLYSFCADANCTDGSYPYATLLQGNNGDFYGTTALGGTGVCKGGCGTVFQMTPNNILTRLYSFCHQTDCGQLPLAGLVEATDGNLYGTTELGGSFNSGTLFEIVPQGASTLHSFCAHTRCSDGKYPDGGLVQATDGNFYGTTAGGGGYKNGGTVFRLSTGLGPFVSFVGNPAKVGQMFGILGQGFKGTASVTLNGTSMSFTVVSDTFIKATVPSGAMTGYVTVATPGGTLTSNVSFRVIP
jgi:uncharacterized repeat protein (TIGR03803 family)